MKGQRKNSMKAIIPVAGFGTRMRPHTLTHPKVLLPVADKPMIAHIVEKLIDDGVEKLIFVVGYLGDKIEAFIKNTYHVQSHFVEQKEFLGLGHAIFTAKDFLDHDSVLIVLGDTIYDVDLSNVVDNPKNYLGVKKIEDPKRFGVAILDNNGNVEKVIEKPQQFVSDLALVGIYYFNNGEKLKFALNNIISKQVKTKNEYQLTDALQLMIEQGEKFLTFNVEGWYDCGKPETLLETNGILLKRDFRNQKYKLENSIVIPPVYIHPDAKISNSIIGPNVTIGKKSVIEESIIKNSIINDDTIIRRINLKDSLIGIHARIEGRNKILNFGDYSQFNLD
jgi:glucose-1-phosphate thymidylyltransferase